ncbi:hypothetical protein N9U20_01080 [bacterium]|nr:hypothetical protein [bacterium]
MKQFFIFLLFSIFTFTNSILAEQIFSEEAKEMMNDHVKSSELLKVPLPKINRIIKDFDRYKDYRKNVMANSWSHTNYLWKDEIDGKILTKELCTKAISEFKVPSTSTIQEKIFKKCQRSLMSYATIDFEGGIDLHEEIILKITTSEKDNWVYKNSGADNFNPRDYQLWGVLSPLVIFYAVNYDQFNFTEDQHKTIQNYFKEKAMIERLDRDGNRSRTKLCPIENPMKLNKKKHKVNNCGTVRLRFASAELALAIVMQDKELWSKGLWDLDYVLSMVGKEGHFIPTAAKGCKALGYSLSTSRLFSTNVELLNLAKFNLLDYKTRHGKTLAEAYEQLFKIYDDITLIKHIAKKGVGAFSCGTKPFKTHLEHIIYERGGLENYKKDIRYGRIPDKQYYINWSMRFVTEKHPEWVEDKFSPHEVKVFPFHGSYYHIQPIEIFNANIMSEGDNLWTKKLAEKPKDYEKKYRFSEFKIFNKNTSGRYKLKSSNVTFTSNTSPIKPKKQFEHQLYKAFIKGNLISKEDKKISFGKALVYQDRYDEIKHQILSVYIGENSNEDVILPLFRHRENIQKKCGTLFVDLNLIGGSWMNFISETNNINLAKSQQCIHNFFSETNDNESLELFEAILAGTDSILKYLKDNENLRNLQNDEKKIAKVKITEPISEPLEENFTIFKNIDGVFKLNSNNVDFISNTNPIKPKRQKEDQLFKSIIKGNLINEDNKKIKFDEALVYKRKFDTDDQVLVVYIGDKPGKDTITPFFRHSENIQKKCGTRFLNQWGWMSFISETNNEKFIKNQQCHYDYFKETDDVEALELFEAVLGGTNSILKYLKENVK